LEDRILSLDPDDLALPGHLSTFHRLTAAARAYVALSGASVTRKPGITAIR